MDNINTFRRTPFFRLQKGRSSKNEGKFASCCCMEFISNLTVRGARCFGSNYLSTVTNTNQQFEMNGSYLRALNAIHLSNFTSHLANILLQLRWTTVIIVHWCEIYKYFVTSRNDLLLTHPISII